MKYVVGHWIFVGKEMNSANGPMGKALLQKWAQTSIMIHHMHATLSFNSC
jgi:hypothetical protein